jgi:hypothetical protein
MGKERPLKGSCCHCFHRSQYENQKTDRAMNWAAAIMLTLVVTSPSPARDLYYGWPGQGSWTTLPFVVVEELLAVETFRSKDKDKTRVAFQQVRDWKLAEKELRP